MERRAAALAGRAVERRPPWVRRLGSPPDDPAARAAWMHRVRVVATLPRTVEPDRSLARLTSGTRRRASSRSATRNEHEPPPFVHTRSPAKDAGRTEPGHELTAGVEPSKGIEL